MEPIQQAALASIKIEPAVRNKVDPGKHEVNFTVHVTGTVKVNEDHMANVTASIPWQKMVAVLLSKVNGVTVEAVVREAVEGNVQDSEVKAEAADAMADIIAPSRKNRKGAVTTDLHLEVV